MTKSKETSRKHEPKTSETTVDGLFGRLDPVLVVSALALIAIGLWAVASSSTAFSVKHYGDPHYVFYKQLVGLCIGSVAAYVAYRVPTDFWYRRAGWFFVILLIACLLVLIPGIGIKAGGARRWLGLAGLRVQPSEFMKLAVLFFASALLARELRKPTGTMKALILPVAIAQLGVGLVVIEDLGSAVVMELVLGVLILAVGLPLKWFGLMLLGIFPIFYHFVASTPFRIRRIMGFIDPWAHRETSGYQITEALISIGSGGISGVGLGSGKKQLHFLPEPHTDFIFAIWAEETGFIGAVVLIALFTCITLRGWWLSRRLDDAFDKCLAVGLTALIGLPAMFNLYVALGMVPTKGLALPFISAGLSHFLASLIALGILLKLSTKRVIRSAGKVTA